MAQRYANATSESSAALRGTDLKSIQADIALGSGVKAKLEQELDALQKQDGAANQQRKEELLDGIQAVQGRAATRRRVGSPMPDPPSAALSLLTTDAPLHGRTDARRKGILGSIMPEPPGNPVGRGAVSLLESTDSRPLQGRTDARRRGILGSIMPEPPGRAVSRDSTLLGESIMPEPP